MTKIKDYFVVDRVTCGKVTMETLIVFPITNMQMLYERNLERFSFREHIQSYKYYSVVEILHEKRRLLVGLKIANIMTVSLESISNSCGWLKTRSACFYILTRVCFKLIACKSEMRP